MANGHKYRFDALAYSKFDHDIEDLCQIAIDHPGSTAVASVMGKPADMNEPM